MARLAEEPDLLGSFGRFYTNGQRQFARDEGFYATPEETVEENHAKLDEMLNEVGSSPDEITVQRE